MRIDEPALWSAGAISTTLVMLVVLTFLTIDSLKVTAAGGANVPNYTVINQKIGYRYNWHNREDMPVIGETQLLFGKTYNKAQAYALMRQGKLVIQTRACMDCHTIFGNGAYYAPDLTKSWLDPAWHQIWMPMTGARTQEEAMVRFLMNPEKYPTWNRRMPDLNLTRSDAVAVVAYLKWLSSINTNGFPANFGKLDPQR